MRYCYPFGCWFVWNGKYWAKDDGCLVEGLAKDTVKKIHFEVEREDYERKQSLIKHALASEARQKINNMIALAQSEPGISINPSDFDGDHWKLNCRNSVIDLKTGEFLPHKRDYLMTQIIQVDYDPNAHCPNWETFINRIMRDKNGDLCENTISFLQKAIGYSLTGSINEQVLFVLFGSGRNGKSTFINILKELLGDYAKQANPETFIAKQASGGIPNDLARLKGSRLVTAVEIEEGKRMAESLVKQLTGGEPIIARFLHQEFFEFLPTFKLFLVTNHIPLIRGTDEGIWRRMRLIQFNAVITPEEMDKNLTETLLKELSGILNWAVAGCLMWQREGLGVPTEIVEATDGYRNEMDSFKSFIDECCVINPKAIVATQKLYSAFHEWCSGNGEHPITRSIFISRLRELSAAFGNSITEFRTSKYRGWQGIGLVDETDLSDIRQPADHLPQPSHLKFNLIKQTGEWEKGEI